MNNDDSQQKQTKQRNKSLRNKIIIALPLMIAVFFMYLIFPVFQPYQGIHRLQGKSEIKNGKIVSITVAKMGINGYKTTNPEIIQQWSDFLKTAKCRPKCLLIYDRKPDWVNITMEDGTIYYFEKWPDFRIGRYVYQFEEPETAEKLFTLVAEDRNCTTAGIKKGL